MKVGVVTFLMQCSLTKYGLSNNKEPNHTLGVQFNHCICEPFSDSGPKCTVVLFFHCYFEAIRTHTSKE